MDSHEHALLRALASAMRLTRATELGAEQVNEVAALLQLSLEEVPALVTRLQDEDLVRLHWGGRVALTSKGQARAEGTVSPGATGDVQIGNVGPGAQVVFGSPGAVVGPGAMGAGAVRVDFGLGDLAAARQALRHAQEGLSPEAKATAQQLEGEAAAIARAVQQPQPDRKSLVQQLDQATTLLGKLTNVAETAQKLGPTLTLLGSAFEAVRRGVLGG